MAEEQKEKPKGQLPYGDPVLIILLETLERTDSNFGITLSIDGQIITGQIITAQEYFEQVSKHLGEGWKVIGEELLKKPVDAEWSPPNFIHLRNAQVATSTGQFPQNKTHSYWRGRLSAVTGFWPGTFDVEQR